MAGRIEEDLLGKREIPEDAYYGVQTLRAIENFHISGKKIQDVPEFVRAMVQVKKAVALANEELHALPHDIVAAIVAGCDEVLEKGRAMDQFPVDVFQGGAGTSVNMNANEVVANLALELLGYEKGRYDIINPNDHVNKSQSTNDAYPTGFRVAVYTLLQEVERAVQELSDAFARKGEEFKDILKMGRTQLQDAVPMTLGQEFNGFSVNIAEELTRLSVAGALLLEMNLGATAIGTGVNTPEGYPKVACQKLAEVTGYDIVPATNLLEATSDNGAYLAVHAVLKRLASKLSKICDDLRLLSSGPRCGLHEINLPEMQPGSSIMPAKVNPVIPEVVDQVCFKVMGNDVALTHAAAAGQLQLNVMEPAAAQCMFESIELLTNAIETLRTKCIDGITANREVCEAYVHNSIGIVTYLNDIIGHHNGDLIGKEAAKTGKSVKELVIEKGLMSAAEVDEVLSVESLMSPHYTGKVWGDDERGLPQR